MELAAEASELEQEADTVDIEVDNGADLDAASIASQTSTEMYGQEPWETFQHKVSEFCATLFPDVSASMIAIESLRGGGFNRITAVTVKTPEPKKWTLGWLASCFQVLFIAPAKLGDEVKKYILRIPRWGSEGIAYDVAALAFASKAVDYPVPEVVTWELSEKNVLGSGYMLQRRILGENLDDLWLQLNFEQRKCAARQFVALMVHLHSITNPACGIISPTDMPTQNPASGRLWFKLETFEVPCRDTSEEFYQLPRASPAGAQSTLDWMLEQCARWKAYEITAFRRAWEVWDDLVLVAKHMDALGFLPSTDGFHLCHLDLQPRNVMFRVNSPTTVEMTGVLDWDSAIFAPKFVSSRAPFWLWVPESELEDGDETQALRVPENEEGIEFKRIFEVGVDEEFLNYAYAPEYVLARTMFRILKDGLGSNESVAQAMEIVKEWKQLHLDARDENV
ncbi:hypothetical protein BCR34DRAFT_499652 [Clohesyomyces aquaticus]|uniref:Aminoglycoside phosphotransferase domain-containing protein n=1 Tax=Clohesyomyces aquaticus TaxID=1231657 RepID=A0A1Y1Y768_9PLEO|nr:hypothetical protein BCR34DRAFT_499652 [Clohesyomyces aquaticus]